MIYFGLFGNDEYWITFQVFFWRLSISVDFGAHWWSGDHCHPGGKWIYFYLTPPAILRVSPLLRGEGIVVK